MEAIKDFIEEFPNEIVIFSLAPLTNIALLYKLHPEISWKIKSLHVRTFFIELIKIINLNFQIMGGNHLGRGNKTNHAEFNFWCDPEAAHIVFEESSCPIYVFPWETCVSTGEAIPFNDWRIKRLSSNLNPFTKFLDEVEIKAYKRYTTWMPCDCFLAATFILPEIVTKMEEHHLTVELGGNHCRVLMLLDHHIKNKKPNAFIIKEIDAEKFKKFMLWVCQHDLPENIF